MSSVSERTHSRMPFLYNYIHSKEVLTDMSTPNHDELSGKWEQTKGWVKDKAGEITNNPDLEAKGEAQRAEGETQESWGKLKRGVGDAVDAVGDAISDAGDRARRT